jgi:hypothetical protein
MSYAIIHGYPRDQKIGLIKAIRQAIPGLGLKEAKDLSERPLPFTVECQPEMLDAFLANCAALGIEFEKKNTVRIVARPHLDADLARQLRAFATRRHTTQSEVLRQALIDYLLAH